MKMNDIGLGQGGPEGSIGYEARKFNELTSDNDTINGIKVASTTYENIRVARENKGKVVTEKPKIIMPEEKPVKATTAGFFDGPGLTELSDLEKHDEGR